MQEVKCSIADPQLNWSEIAKMSYVCCIRTAEGFVAASDTRSCTNPHQYGFSYNDNFQKIYVLEDKHTLIAQVGNNCPNGVWFPQLISLLQTTLSDAPTVDEVINNIRAIIGDIDDQRVASVYLIVANNEIAFFTHKYVPIGCPPEEHIRRFTKDTNAVDMGVYSGICYRLGHRAFSIDEAPQLARELVKIAIQKSEILEDTPTVGGNVDIKILYNF